MAAAIIRMIEAWVYGVHPDNQFLFPFLAMCVVFVMSGAAATLMDVLRTRVEQLEKQIDEYVEQLFRLNRREEETNES